MRVDGKGSLRPSVRRASTALGGARPCSRWYILRLDIASLAELRTSPEDDVLKLRDQNVLAAAMIAMRDGSPELRTKSLEWAIGLFELVKKDSGAGRMRQGIRFNPSAIAFVGLANILKYENTPLNQRRLLELAARDAAGSRGFQVAAPMLADIDERLPRSILRSAFSANIRQHRVWDLGEDEKIARETMRQKRLQSTIDAELRWLSGEGAEPDWPEFRERRPNRRRGIRLPGGPPEVPEEPTAEVESYTDHQGAALWLRGALTLMAVHRMDWFRSMILAYAAWTGKANGVGMDSGAEPSSSPREWNDEYFALLANSLEGLPADQVDRLTIEFLEDSPISPSMTPLRTSFGPSTLLILLAAMLKPMLRAFDLALPRI